MCWIRVVEKRPGIAWYPSTSSYASTKKKKKKRNKKKRMYAFFCHCQYYDGKMCVKRCSFRLKRAYILTFMQVILASR